MLKIEDKTIVVPGELIAKGQEYLAGEGTYREGEDLYSCLLGLAEVRGKFVKIIPLSGRYLPRMGDTIIGVVADIASSFWIVDINSPYDSILPLSEASHRFIERGEELTRYFKIGDVILTKIGSVSKSKNVSLTMRSRGLEKLQEGRLITIQPAKVPRVIGKAGTMVNMIKDYTGSRIVVGQNGRIWIKADPEQENLVVEVIEKISAEAHIPGLTDRIREMLDKRTGKKIAPRPKPVEAKPAPVAAPAKPAPAPKPAPAKPAPKLQPKPVKKEGEKK